jgi:transposase
MDRGIPTEEVLGRMRASDPPVHYLVGTPKGRLSQLEKSLLELPWQEARPGVEVKLLSQDGEAYVLAKSLDRVNKERAMRRRQWKKLWARLHELRAMKNLKRDALLMKLGAARQQNPAAWRLIALRAPKAGEEINEQTFLFRLRKDKLRQVRRREGRYLLRTNLTEKDPPQLWGHYIQLTQIEEAFKNLKGDLAIRPIFHQDPNRIEAHIFVSFLAYCAHVSLREKLRRRAPGLTPRSALEKFAALQMLDVHFPTTDGRELIFSRYTQPEAEQKILLNQLNLILPEQSPPRITAARQLQM